jgi:DNA-binding NarL/FixJ family response regulator
MAGTGKHKPDGRKRRAFLVEDHPVTLEGFARLINLQPDLAVCGEASTAGEALKKIPLAKPDIAIVDISLAGGNGLDLVKDLSAQHPGCPVLVLSMHDEGIYAGRAIRAGARGYIMKNEPIERVLDGIRGVLRGEIRVSERMRTELLEQLRGMKSDASGVALLSDRELEVFRMIGTGLGTREISRHLRIGISTVESYRAHIKDKLGLKNAAALVTQAARWVQGHD